MDQILKLNAKKVLRHKTEIIEKFGLSERTFWQTYNLYISLSFITIFNELSLAKDEKGPQKVSFSSFVSTDSENTFEKEEKNKEEPAGSYKR
jgi:hypothetical protein